MRRLRPFASLVFALIVALTSGAMAVARGQSAASGALVLCTAQGVVSVQVDDQGRPAGPAHICPDCALSLFAAHAASQPEVARPAGAILSLWAAAALSAPAARVPAAYDARGPPSLV